MKFILFCVTLDLSDNLTEMRIVEKLDLRYFFRKYETYQNCFKR